MPALIAGVAASGVMNAIAAKKQATAAKQAGQIQQQAADRVAPINRAVYQQQMAGMEPYAAAGRNSMNTLSRLMTPGVPYNPQLQMQDARAQYNAPPPWSMDPGGGGQAMPRDSRGGSLGNLAQSLVQLRAPNGSVRVVPSDQVEALLARGATRV